VAVDESVRGDEAPPDYVARLAAAKADSGWGARATAGAAADAPVLAADTTVVLGGEIFGKPRDDRDGEAMLLKLSGRTHEVLTAVALRTAGGVRSRLSRSEVTFRAIGRAEARAYWDSGEPHDKAGGYAVQGLGAVFIARLSGSFSGVMGLPLYETAELLAAAGVPMWQPAPGAA
jgi:septum formation protein